jgi:hypothetical protein
MPDRYHIHTTLTPSRFHRIGKFGGIDFREDCSRCSNCVKPRCCFDVYTHEATRNRDPLVSAQTLYECRACFSCVQGCTKGLLNLSVNPEFLDLGDDYWKPDILLSTWTQADAGIIPVSGAGYRGRFHGPGFDSIWTDMSEIVRPTRDGIHGREYISTSVDIGPKPMHLGFNSDGTMRTQPLNLLELQIPAVMDVPAWPMRQAKHALARVKAAKELKAVALVYAQDAAKLPKDLMPFAVPILEMSRRGIKVFHLCADLHGCERLENGESGRHIKDVLREIHDRLVSEGIRDEITVIISGGIALAEHMAKAIICGADLVGVDTALLVAVGCRVCRHVHTLNIESGYKDVNAPIDACPVNIEAVDSTYAAQRMTNLMGAWHSQLIEVLGAMGIREVRRLRGEMGRAIFMEEIEKEAFGDLLHVPQEEVA